jgi:hypothetical protein
VLLSECVMGDLQSCEFSMFGASVLGVFFNLHR